MNNQWEIKTWLEEYKEVKYQLERHADFHLWLEDNYLPETIDALFRKFEEWEDQQDKNNNSKVNSINHA